MDESNKHNSINISTSKKNLSSSYVDQLRLVSLPKLITESSYINPNVCLNRKDILEEDKKKSLFRVFSKHSPRDISHFMDSQIKKSKQSALPSNLLDMKKWLSENKSRNPTSSKEIEYLDAWLQDMNKTYLPSLESSISGKIPFEADFVEKVETIYYVALNEVLRQVSVLCKSRAEILKGIISTLSTVWRKYIEYLKNLVCIEKETTVLDMEANDLANQAKLLRYQQQINKLTEEVNKLTLENAILTEDSANLRSIISNLSKENQDLIKSQSVIVEKDSIPTQTDIIQEITLKIKSRSSSLSDDSLKLTPRPLLNDSISPSPQQNMAKEAFRFEFESLCYTHRCTDLKLEEISSKLAEEVKDFDQWLEGFKLGLQIRQIQESNMANPPSSANNLSPILSPRSRPKQVLLSPKLKRFNTSRNLIDTNQTSPKDLSSASTLVSYIDSQPLNRLAKQSKSSSKKTLANILKILNLAILKKYSKEMRFSEFAFSYFVDKYTGSNLANKKFQEFVTGCIVHCATSPKIGLFLRALHAGSKLELAYFSSQGCEMWVRVVEFMVTSRTGVLIDPASPLTNKFFPYIRAVECVKLKLEPLMSKSEVNFLLDSLGKMNSADPSTINKQGVVDFDEFLERFMESYEKYVNKIKTGASICVKIMTEYNYLTKGEIVMIIRHLCPVKQHQIMKLLPFDHNFEIDNKDFIEYCVILGILSNSSVAEFFSGFSKNSKEILDFLNENEERILESMQSHTGESLQIDQWQFKIDEIKCKLRTPDTTKYFQLWHILKKELEYFHIVN